MTLDARLPKRYSAAVLGDGRVLPIEERIGRRLIREIEPLSQEGRSLLASGTVALWHEDGARHETAAIAVVLDRQALKARTQRQEFPGIREWQAHHDDLLRRIHRMKKALRTP